VARVQAGRRPVEVVVTDRLVAFTVTLERDVREDDAQAIVTAIRMVKGVSGVVPVVADAGFYVAREQARSDLAAKLFQVLHPKRSEGG
jgi:hypothetical protein